MRRETIAGQPGWHEDPTGRFESRYWDGSRWTSAVMLDGQVDTDPDESLVSEIGEPARVTTPPPEDSGPKTGTAPSAMSTAIGWTAADRFTSLPLAEAQARIVQLLPIAGIVLTDDRPGCLAAQVNVAGEPNWIAVVALSVLWLLPGLIYWYVKSRPVAHPLAVQLFQAELGTRIALQGDAVAVERFAPVLAQLPW